MSDWSAWVGREAVQEDVLTPALLQRFRATIDNDGTNHVAPQGIHWCVCLPDAATSTLGKDGHPRRDGTPASFMPPVRLPRRMWASSEVDFHAPLTADTKIVRRSTITSVTEKQGGSGHLVFVQVNHTTHADGVLAVDETQTIVYREAPATPSPPPAPGPGFDPEEWELHREILPSETLLFRYSALTFNSHRIHYDQPYATAEEGYPGLVVHGPLTATLLLDLAARELGETPLARFSFRALSPAFAGDIIHLLGKTSGGTITLAAISGNGRVVMSAEGER